MPKQTFFNLAEEKREKIYNAILNEFSEFSYDNASINRIVKNAGIAKGSLYQYFEDKKDIFTYIINEILNMKMSYISPVMMNPKDIDLFTLIREMYLSGIKFANDNPKFNQIGLKLLSDVNHPIYEELVSEGMGKSNDIFEGLLINAINKGEVKEGIDVKFISYIITTLNKTVGEYYFENNNSGSYDDMIQVVDKVLDLLKNGISK